MCRSFVELPDCRSSALHVSPHSGLAVSLPQLSHSGFVEPPAPATRGGNTVMPAHGLAIQERLKLKPQPLSKNTKSRILHHVT